MKLNMRWIAGDSAASTAVEHSIYTLDCIYNYVGFYISALRSIYLGISDNRDSTVFGTFGASKAVI